MPMSIIRRLANHVEHFNCRVVEDGRLKPFQHPPQRHLYSEYQDSLHVGTASGDRGLENWKIERLNSKAPDYLKPLVGKEYATKIQLENAVRRVAFLNKVRQLFDDQLKEAEWSPS